MIIGVPKERKTLEQRVALTPSGVQELCKMGSTVLLEQGAGVRSFFSDEQYAAAGAQVVKSLAEVWQRADMIVKVKEPHADEYQYFRKGLIVFDYLHLAGLPEVAKALITHKVTGIAYESIQLDDGRLPLLEPMSEVAGKLSVLNGAHCLLAQNGGRGVLLGGTVGTSAANVVIVGAGIAGRSATSVAVGMGAKVTVLDIQYAQLDKIRSEFQNAVQTEYSTETSLLERCRTADLVISAVLLPGARAPQIFKEEHIKAMPEGSVFVDISIDQGGSAVTTRPTSLEEPTYTAHGVIHYAVPNMPAQTARTSTIALTATTLPYVKKLASLGLAKALRSDPYLARGLNTWDGHYTNSAVASALQSRFLSIDEVLRSV